MYKYIIFDIGNVIINFRPQDYLKTKINEPQKVLEVYKEIFQSEEWLMLDRGTITEEEAKSNLIARSKGNGDFISLAFKNWFEILTPIEGTIEILYKLKKSGYNLYFLSNYHMLAFEHVNNQYDFFNLFNGGIVSYREKTIKPEKEIYKRLIERYNIKPEEAIFIDDSKENTDVAKKMNFRVIIFLNPLDLVEKLKAYSIYLL